MTDTDWASRYAQGDTPWDKSMPAPPLMEGVARGLLYGRMLVPGCGFGNDARALAEIPGASVVGLDIVPQAVEEACRRYGSPGLSLEFVVGDFFNLPADYAGTFDALVEHTCFCAINPSMRSRYVDAAARALRSGGVLFGIFFINPDVDEGPPHKVSVGELGKLFGDRFDLVAEWVPTKTFPGRENRELVRVLRRR